MAKAQLVTLILVDDVVGAGTNEEPCQRRQTLFTLDGRPVATKTALGGLNFVDADNWDELGDAPTLITNSNDRGSGRG